jgi:outer membrane protein assembly factor BamB
MKRLLAWMAAGAVLLAYAGSYVASSDGQQASSKSKSAVAGKQDRGVGDFPKLSAQHDWPWWRGPSRNGIAPTNDSVPVRWSESQNIIWRTPLPGRGHSSPIIVGNQIFLATADEREQVQSVLAFDLASGKPLWKTDVLRGGFPERIHRNNTHASPTVACDGERLFVSFFNHDTLQATALSLDGKQIWQKTVGPFRPRRFEYGYGASPQLYRDTVIMAAEFDGASYIAALDRKTGKQVWQTSRPENISFSSPVIAHVAGRDQLLISGAGQVASYAPQTGKQLWSVPGTTAATCGTAVWDGDIVIASGGYPKSETVAIRADGKGEVVWRNAQKCYEQSLLAYDGYVYGLTDNGVLFCWRVSDGQEMWKQRLQGPVSASPVLAGGHIYWANERGTMYVFKPNPMQAEIVAENKLGDESFASPAVSGGRLFLRVASNASGKREETLYCIGASK